MAVVRPVALPDLLELRERVLTPGHPGRPVVWPYDNDQAEHFGLFLDDQLAACASVTPQPMPDRSADHPYHLHSMAVEPQHQCSGWGRFLLGEVLGRLPGADLVWATARPSALGFYRRCGFEVGEETRISPTNAVMHYVWFHPGQPGPPHPRPGDPA
jgi:ribosomal protein S18 acetylase RimI-like enzyme